MSSKEQCEWDDSCRAFLRLIASVDSERVFHFSEGLELAKDKSHLGDFVDSDEDMTREVLLERESSYLNIEFYVNTSESIRAYFVRYSGEDPWFSREPTLILRKRYWSQAEGESVKYKDICESIAIWVLHDLVTTELDSFALIQRELAEKFGSSEREFSLKSRLPLAGMMLADEEGEFVWTLDKTIDLNQATYSNKSIIEMVSDSSHLSTDIVNSSSKKASEGAESARARRDAMQVDGALSSFKINEILCRSESGNAKSNLENLEIILSKDARFCDAFGFNELEQKKVMIRGAEVFSVARIEEGGVQITDRMVDVIIVEIMRTYKVDFKATSVWTMLSAICSANSFNPLVDKLMSFRWDGELRAEDLLINIAGAPPTDATRMMTRKFLLGMCYRALEAGCKFDTMLILEGAQGIKKSTFFDVLSMGYFTDDLRDIGAKGGIEIMMGKWLCELSELSSMKSAGLDIMKAFITRKEDIARMAYQREAQSYPRRCVFGGSTNSSEYLSDETGNRRFFCISCTSIDLDYLRSNLELIWAEVMGWYMVREKPYIDDEKILSEINASQKSRFEVDEMGDSVCSYVYDKMIEWRIKVGKSNSKLRGNELNMLAISTFEGVTIKQIWVDAFDGSLSYLKRVEQDRISKIMRDFGFSRKRRRVDGVQIYTWVPIRFKF